jgi:hypothetical protein
MKGTLASILIVITLCGFASSAIADQIFVDPESSTIQAAIDVACDGDEVLVAPGVYEEAIDFLGKDIVVRSTDGAQVTMIDASGYETSAVVIENNWAANTRLDGFTITGGSGKLRGGKPRGGGVYAEESMPTIANCVISGNTAAGGGGLSLVYCWTTVIDCVFMQNTATNGGDLGGAGIQSTWGSVTIVNCDFVENTGTGTAQGGGVCVDAGDAVITNCRFWGNDAFCGGGVANLASDFVITNCSFANNTAGYGGGALMAAYGGADTLITNCILWGNSSQNYDDEIHEEAGPDTVVRYSNVRGGWEGEGNIDVDPLFRDAENGDLTLLDGSPCIDAGDNSALPPDDYDMDGDGDFDEPIPFDLAYPHQARIVFGGGGGGAMPFHQSRALFHAIARVDMGAYEYQP